MNNEIVFAETGKVFTTSLLVAQKFGKRHASVLRIIQKKLENPRTAQERNIVLMFTTRELANGAVTKDPYYIMDKSAFTFIVMGFTGEQADDFKNDYINAFEAMEAKLVQSAQETPISKELYDVNYICEYGRIFYRFTDLEKLTGKNPGKAGIPAWAKKIETSDPHQKQILRVGTHRKNAVVYFDRECSALYLKDYLAPKAIAFRAELLSPPSNFKFLN